MKNSMQISKKLLSELQNRLKVGNRRGVHLNGLPGKSSYKFDLTKLSFLDPQLPKRFIEALLNQMPLKFNFSWKVEKKDTNSLFEEDQTQLVKISRSFERLISQVSAIESEKGVNTFGFGFPMLIRKDQADNKLTASPVLIWSLRIKRSNDFNSWEVHRADDDPIYLNEVLINHLQKDSNCLIHDIPEEALADGLISQDELIAICVDVLKVINNQVGNNLSTILKEKLEKVATLRERKHYEKLVPDSRSSLVEFGGIFSIFEVQKQNIIIDYDGLFEGADLKLNPNEFDNHSFQSISSVDTDPSQQGIINSLKGQRNILIQGPPGTGKSQTLTGILVNALENKKKTLVVCEKRTALDVLEKALINRGLNSLCILIKDVVKDRRPVVNSVRNRVDHGLDLGQGFFGTKENISITTGQIQRLIDAINSKHVKLGEAIYGKKTWKDVVGDWMTEHRDLNQRVELYIERDSFKFDPLEFNTIIETVKKGQYLYLEFLDNNGPSFLNTNKLFGDNPYLVEQEILSAFKAYEVEINHIEKLVPQLRDQYFSIRKKEYNDQLIRVMTIELKLKEIIKRHTNDEFVNQKRTGSFFYKLGSSLNARKKRILNDLKQFRLLLAQLEVALQESQDLASRSFSEEISRATEEINSLHVDPEILKIELSNKLVEEFDNLDFLRISRPNIDTSELRLMRNALEKLRSLIISDDWIKDLPNNLFDLNSNELIETIKSFLKNKQNYFESDEDYFTYEFAWLSYYNSLDNREKIILDQLLKYKNWEQIFSAFYLDCILATYSTNGIGFRDLEIKELNKKFENFRTEQLVYIKNLWSSIQNKAISRFEVNRSGITVANLYNKRKSTRHKRLALREIVKVDIDLFSSFFPVILTTPEVASNLFRGKNEYFDIVLFDEASQLKLEDTLPALLKGKQIIISGDEHQMPPSNYFSSIFDGSLADVDDIDEESDITIDDVDKDDILLSSESLLEFAEQASFESKFLEFHYRSRHPYLIDFSNFAFYKQRLKPLPATDDYIPIKYIQCEGTYAEHTNEVEANIVLDIIQNNISRLPNGEYPTIGIACFNIAQRNLIKSKIQDRRQLNKYEDFSNKVLELEENGMFIHNLENIQGDERDIIIISTTFGYNIEGNFFKRFGPITHSKGYKLLNVIITRAKYKVYLCTSIPEIEFGKFRDYLLIEGSNNRRAVFYAYLAYSKAVSENNDEARNAVLNTLAENAAKDGVMNYDDKPFESPFEEEVYLALLKHFNEDQLLVQHQYAGFRIDIVYRSRNSAVPKVAVECDGATYHSSPEAYLHDMQRQRILEDHDFVFHRIWSTNWWRNRDKQIQLLVSFIKEVESSSKGEQNSVDSFTDAMSHETPAIVPRQAIIVPKQKTLAQLSPTKTTLDLEVKEPEIEHDEITRIQNNHRIKILYLNIDKEFVIHLVDEEIRQHRQSNGAQKVNIRSSLGQSLIGKTVGETVQIGSLNNYVEILEIL
jgi:very-short-patch-repair endonuclease